MRLLPHSSIVVPEEVRLRGRHAPTDPTETLNYFEVHHMTDDAGKVRTAPFVVRAPSPREFEDWLRALRWCLARLRRGSLSEEPSAGGVSRDFYLSGGSAAAGLSVASSAAGVTPETHTACARRGDLHMSACGALTFVGERPSRRWRGDGAGTPSSRRSYGDNIASTAW